MLHKVKEDRSFNFCSYKTFELKEKSPNYKYFRFSLDQECPDMQKCMQINQIELYGETIDAGYEMNEESEDEESISI